MTAGVLSPLGGVTAWDGEAVAAFDRGGEDILVVSRTPLAGVTEAALSARVYSYKAVVGPVDAERRAADALAAVGIDCPALADDIAALAGSFLAQFGAGEASLRVEAVDKQSCPKFHCDNVRVRLVVTYHGPATEYVRADDPRTIRAAPASALVFLKGHKHPNHADAVQHRSPTVPPGGKRLCVILDC